MSRRLVTALAALVALGGLAGCGGTAASEEPELPIAAPPQQAARIAAIRLRSGNPPRFALLTLGDDGSEPRVLVQAPTETFRRLDGPAWSPDAKRVYFVGVLAEREGDRFTYYESDVFVVDANGGEPRRVTSFWDLTGAVPSPDDQTLLVARDEHPGKRPFATGLWLVDADGANERRVAEAKDGQLDFPGSWSPDGRMIAFTRCTFPPPYDAGLVGNSCAVFTAFADGSLVRKLAERSSDPAFSPDGRLIAFVSDRDENGKHRTGSDEEQFADELYVMDANGSNQRRLTESASLDESAPAWSPDGSRIAFAREGPAVFQDELLIANADGSCPTVLLGDAGDRTLGAPSFNSPAWRPGRLTGEPAALGCRQS